MIDIDKIESQCEAAIQNGYGHLPVIECGNAAKVSELIGLLRQSEKDAARYRWIARKVGANGVIDGWAFSFPTHLSLPAPPIALSDPEYALGISIDEAMSVNQS